MWHRLQPVFSCSRGAPLAEACATAACPTLFDSAGPRPIAGRCYETCFDWILFDVVLDSREFGGVSNPMIEGFVLPETLAVAT